MLSTVLSFLPRAIAQGIPLLYGATGEIVTQKSGNMNLGIPGVMYVGGICGVIGAFLYEGTLSSPAAINPFLAVLIPTLFCLVGSLLMGLLFCFLTVTLRANQNVTGLAMTTFGIGFGNFFHIVSYCDNGNPLFFVEFFNYVHNFSTPFSVKHRSRFV